MNNHLHCFSKQTPFTTTYNISEDWRLSLFKKNPIFITYSLKYLYEKTARATEATLKESAALVFIV